MPALSASRATEIRSRNRLERPPGPTAPGAGGAPAAVDQLLRTVALSITTVAFGLVLPVCGSGVIPASAIFFSTSMPSVTVPKGV